MQGIDLHKLKPKRPESVPRKNPLKTEDGLRAWFEENTNHLNTTRNQVYKDQYEDMNTQTAWHSVLLLWQMYK